MIDEIDPETDLSRIQSVTFSFWPEQPKIFGYWRLPCTNMRIVTYSKPRWLTRILMKHVLQWEWRDA